MKKTRIYRINGKRPTQERVKPLEKEYEFARKFAKDVGIELGFTKKEFKNIVKDEWFQAQGSTIYKNKKEVAQYIAEKMVRDQTNDYETHKIRTLSTKQAELYSSILKEKLNVAVNAYDLMTGKIDLKPYLEMLKNQAIALQLDVNYYIYGS